MNVHLQHAARLIDQSRHELAEEQLRLALAQEPQDALAHALMAQCLCEREKFDEAQQEVQQSIHLAPDLPYAHYAHARLLVARNRFKEAAAAAQEAIRLAPEDPDYYALLSLVHYNLRNWPAALQNAEQGLQLDAEHTGCANLRTMTLVKLGRAGEAAETINATLAKNPEDDLSHANQGWVYLEQNQSQKALEHFREALRLDPDNEWARQGIVEALKARSVIYAFMLKYFLWMSKLSPRAQWGVVIGGYFLNRLLGSFSRLNPELAPWLLPLRILFIVFVLMTWIADPLFNLLLRLNRFGRLVLSREQVVASNWVGATIGCALACLLVFFLSREGSSFLLAAVVFGGTVIPLAATFRCWQGWPRRTMAIYSAVMAAAGLLGCVLLSLPNSERTAAVAELQQTGELLIGLFIIAAIGSGWVANILMQQRVKR